MPYFGDRLTICGVVRAAMTATSSAVGRFGLRSAQETGYLVYL